MCGIVGLHLRDRSLESQLGSLAAQMLEAMTDRGPDSSGIAVYESGNSGLTKYSLRAPSTGYDLPPEGYDWATLGATLSAEVRLLGPDAVLSSPAERTGFLSQLAQTAPEVTLVSWGESLEVFKDVGSPRKICDRYQIRSRSGYQAIGHTRMATESAVTTDHSHPFSPAPDLCFVHNGSFSNYFTVRRDLEAEGVRFETDNDTEVGARLIALEMERGADLGDAMRTLMKTMDGFYTLLVSTKDQFVVVRDAFACKPAVIAETPSYVAMASEYHALAGLPDIEKAEVFEPMPEEIHVWSR
ncbi:MAG: glutamine amidotransferase [Acidimicrobiia bacterium]